MPRFTTSLAALLFWASLPLSAQVTTASLVGTITDSSGGTVAGALIRAKAVATNQVRETNGRCGGQLCFDEPCRSANTKSLFPPMVSERK